MKWGTVETLMLVLRFEKYDSRWSKEVQYWAHEALKRIVLFASDKRGW